MKSLVLESQRDLSLRDIDPGEALGPGDLRIAIRSVGICGSDVHYYTHGRIGPFVVNEPMILGHEASGVVTEVGPDVQGFAVGDRVCMEPGVPDLSSRATLLGLYNVDPSVTFLATPPIHGCLRPEVIHPAAFTFALPDTVSFDQGALVEPLAVGLQACVKARITPGDVAVVLGAGPIGIMTALSALASGCGRVFITDLTAEKLDVATGYPGITAIDISREDPAVVLAEATGGWGADVVFEASGSSKAYDGIAGLARPGGCVVLVGMPVDPVPFDVVSAAAKELRIETVFRYANVFDRAIELLASGKIDLDPLISERFDFDRSVEAFERAAEGRASDVKLMIRVSE
ncbi:NAD(P)-dependent alcohol dehydrogenase [Tropicimonas isoalkanivorans]|uniref:D-xylulose reductase n=1 Tax=Tropicimonas isoalkanivorans TaxID=441112 RepID=A0A1I1MS27_9RHOB|nr:NAD(P)-dependent alcohol dehydrogenase [Tropicimonas isoalkanivorans]SFC87712.1 D-xylulose reductase [Tropicimonas isoalkanivorans]